MTKFKLKIIMAAAEVAPFAKVGGLADVVGSLPPALHDLGADVRIIMPLYGTINRRKFGLHGRVRGIQICVNGREHEINVWEGLLPGTKVPVYFIEYDRFFGQKQVYAEKNNSERFLFFSLAVVHALPQLGFQPDIIHCHDFHTAMIPDILKAMNIAYYEKSKVIYTIHNLNYQGRSEIETLSTGNLTKHSLKTLSRDARDGDVNFMVQGILNADKVTTVSRTYAKEITTSMYGANLEKIIKKRKKDLFGIVNGIDTKFFDPYRDDLIAKKYSVESLKYKKINKLALQKRYGLPQDANIPLCAMIGRLVWQKGLELVISYLEKHNFELEPCQLIFLGTGQPEYEKALMKLKKRLPKAIGIYLGFNEKLAHQIYAGSDIFLMPSRFEPCGLGQMIAMRYGTVPVVALTGGLADTVDGKVGFGFKTWNENAFKRSFSQALREYNNQPIEWRRKQKNGMNRDFSWKNSAKDYLEVYKKAITG